VIKRHLPTLKILKAIFLIFTIELWIFYENFTNYHHTRRRSADPNCRINSMCFVYNFNAIQKSTPLPLRQQKIIELWIRNGPLKTPEILKLLDGGVTVKTIQRDLVKLKELGLVDVVGRARATFWLFLTN